MALGACAGGQGGRDALYTRSKQDAQEVLAHLVSETLDAWLEGRKLAAGAAGVT